MNCILFLVAVAGTLTWTACDDPVCEPVADSCPSDCGEIRGVPIHPVCDWGHVIACVEDPPDVFTTDVACVVRLEDGHVYMIGSGSRAGLLIENGAWRYCNGEERAREAQDCPF